MSIIEKTYRVKRKRLYRCFINNMFSILIVLAGTVLIFFLIFNSFFNNEYITKRNNHCILAQ
jgi:uncharacterized membrane protein